MNKNSIYLDNNSTTPVHPEVIREINRVLERDFGNPSSLHSFGRISKTHLDRARTRVASLINADPGEIVFASGGTEADNLAIKGAASALKSEGKHIITSKIEHPAVLQSCKHLEKQGFDITYIGTDRNGIILLDEFREAIRYDTVLITIMYANNEVGTIQPVEEISKIANSHNIIFHTDAVQAAGKIPIDVKKLDINLLSISGHKINGPKGTGALYIKRGTKIEPQIHGGHQEKNKRTGTENMPGIAGFGKACEIALKNMHKNREIERLRNLLESKISNEIEYITINARNAPRLPGTSNICFHFTEGESIMLSLDVNGIAVSTGSACASGSLESSYVLKAMEVPVEFAQGAVRFSLGNETTEEEINKTIEILNRVVVRVRDISPLYEDMIEGKNTISV